MAKSQNHWCRITNPDKKNGVLGFRVLGFRVWGLGTDPVQRSVKAPFLWAPGIQRNRLIGGSMTSSFEGSMAVGAL